MRLIASIKFHSRYLLGYMITLYQRILCFRLSSWWNQEIR